MHAYRYALHRGPAPGRRHDDTWLVIGPASSGDLLELLIAEFTIATRSGRVLSADDIERMATDAEHMPAPTALAPEGFMRDFKGGYEAGVDGPLLAVRLDDDLDERITAEAAVQRGSPTVLLRSAVSCYLQRLPDPSCPQPFFDLSKWQWLLHLPSDVADQLQTHSLATNCHPSVVVNRAVRWWLANRPS